MKEGYILTRKTMTGQIGDNMFDKNEMIKVSYYQAKEGKYYDHVFSTKDDGMINYSLYKDLPDEDGITTSTKISSKTLSASKALNMLREMIREMRPDKTYEDLSISVTPQGYHDEWKKQYEANMKRYKEELNLKGHRNHVPQKKQNLADTFSKNFRKML